MRGTIAIILMALILAGCKTQTPSADPFNSHPIVPPPSTGSCPTATPDPGYLTSPSSGQLPQARPGVSGITNPTNPNLGANPAGATVGGWTAAGTSVQRPLSSNVAPNTTGTNNAGMIPPPSGGFTGSGVQNPAATATGLPTWGTSANPVSAPPGTGIGNPAGPNNLGNGATGYNPPNYGNPNASTALGSTSPQGNSALGATTPYIIPPPGTQPAGGYPNATTNPPPATNSTAAPLGNPYAPANNINNYRSGPTSPAQPNSPILGTPRPTPSQAANPSVRPTAAIPNNNTWPTGSPHPVDETVQPIRPAPGGTVPANTTTAPNSTIGLNRYAPNAVSGVPATTVASPSMQPRVMPMAPTAYGSPFANPPYCPSINSVIMEPNWQPCDGYADDGE